MHYFSVERMEAIFVLKIDFFFQRLLADMESFKQQVEDVQECHSTLRVPEEVVTSLSICRTALNLQHEASQLQHTAIQQCNILQVSQKTHQASIRCAFSFEIQTVFWTDNAGESCPQIEVG